VGQAFDMGGAPFGVSFFKGCGLSPYADSLLFALACTELLMAWRNSMLGGWSREFRRAGGRGCRRRLMGCRIPAVFRVRVLTSF